MLTYSKTPISMAMRKAKVPTRYQRVFLFYAEGGSGHYRERETADALGIGRKVVRNADRYLERDKWITRRARPTHGTYISVRTDHFQTYQFHPERAQEKQPQKGPSIAREYAANNASPQRSDSAKRAQLLCSSGLRTAVLPAVVSFPTPLTEVLKKDAAQTGAAARLSAGGGGGHGADREPVPNWWCLEEHIKASWTRRCAPAKFDPSKRDWQAVKQRAQTYQAHELAAAWDTFIKSDDRFARQNGFGLRIFASQIAGLVMDDRTYHQRAEAFLTKWEGPPANEVVDKLLGMVGNKDLIQAITIPIRHTPKQALAAEPVEPPTGGLLALWEEVKRKKHNPSQSGASGDNSR